MHGRLDLAALTPIYSRYKTVPLVSISDDQLTSAAFMNWVATAYHGLPRNLLSYSKGPGKYLAFLGRISPREAPRARHRCGPQGGHPDQARGQSREGCRKQPLQRSGSTL